MNWSVLEPYYTGLDGIDAFEPTPESVVGLTTVFVAAKYEEADSFHYFLSSEIPRPWRICYNFFFLFLMVLFL